MAKATVSALVEGGKATAAPPLGPALAPMGVNIGELVAKINEKTQGFRGMQVPVKIIVDKTTKTYEIEVGTPPTSALIKKELGIEKPVKEEQGVKGKKTIGNLSFEQLLKLAETKKDASLSKDLKAQVKEIIGTCVSLGVTVDGKPAKQVEKEVSEGKYDKQLK
ncbi:50S ribosomal protein L11 [Candidatus Micrarchaeota archaeon]|nr:50S ribosomal protein L11 [Candidatus Micrarchaeota archaeon]